MKKLLFATALLAALLLSACGGKTNDDDFMNKPAVTPEPGMEIDPEFGVDPEPETNENAQPAPDAELSDMVDAIYKIQPVEPDTAAILRQALADGKHLLLPRVLSKTAMDWVEIPDLALLRPGAFGILEPPADLPVADPAVFARPLALIPCLAAGRDGLRLGRGGGYYDRLSAHYKGAKLLP